MSSICTTRARVEDLRLAARRDTVMMRDCYGAPMTLEAEPQPPSRGGLYAGLAGLAFLAGLAVYLGANRIYQVDEVQNVMMARLIATGQTGEFSSSAPLMALGPLVWLARRATSSADLFFNIRMLFVAVMGLNLLLMVKAAGGRLRSRTGLGLLLLAATLAPLWDYGFEIRHDNLLLAGMLALWALFRRREGPGFPGLFAAGVLAGLLQILAFKSFLYWIPLLGCGWLWFSPAVPGGRWKAACALLGGVAAGLLLARGLHGLSGTWPLYVADFRAARAYSTGQVQRFWPWISLDRLVVQCPLVLGVLGAAGLWAFRTYRNGGWKAFLAKDGPAPEAAFAALAVAAFLVNPTPFPYNLVLLVPPLFVLGVRVVAATLPTDLSVEVRGLALCFLGSAHLLPWWTATQRHFEFTNGRQVQLMELSERLTDPARHGVFDGSGLVPLRNPVGEHWLVHSFTLARLTDGTWPSVRQQLQSRETPVILPNYRTQWLPREDQAFIEAHYLALAADFLLLGKRGTGGTTEWEALAEGRYLLKLLEAPPDATVAVDGVPTATGIVTLAKGPHRFTYPEQSRLQVLWLGPRATGIPALREPSQPLFINWY